MKDLKIKIKKIYPVYSWHYNITDEMCGICQQNFDQMCSTCSHPMDCKPCVGACMHSYHVHCLETWLKNKSICPMCRVEWKYKRMF